MPWTVGSGCRGIVSRRLVGDTSTQTALPQRRATTSGVSAEHCTPSSSPTKLKGEGLNKSHDDQPSGTSGFSPNHELDCPVPRLTLLFFGAATAPPPGRDHPDDGRYRDRRDSGFPVGGGNVRDGVLEGMAVSVPPAELGRASSPGQSNGHDDTKTWITLSGGTAGQRYTITNTIQLASGGVGRAQLPTVHSGPVTASEPLFQALRSQSRKASR